MMSGPVRWMQSVNSLPGGDPNGSRVLLQAGACVPPDILQSRAGVL